MNFDVEYIEKLAKILDSNNLTEIALEDGEQAIFIKREKEIVTTAVSAPILQSVAAAPAPVAAATSAPTEEVKAAPKGTPITSPIVGTYYSASKPGAAPYVTVGQTVTPDMVVCIVEAMKCMNEINAEVSGTVLEICVQDGQPVEFGQVLMYVG